jgi:hypothetical protein
MGLKPGAIGNTLGEHVENLGNTLGTHWELEREHVENKVLGWKFGIEREVIWDHSRDFIHDL